MTQHAKDSQEYEVFFEGAYGMENCYVDATCVGDLMRQLKKSFPDDVGADGFFTCPKTGEEKPLKW